VIAFLTAAFWLSYYAVFFSIALVAASLLAAQFNREVREVMVTAWRRFFRWPEGLAVAILHGGGFAWFMIGYGRAGLAAPPHVSAYILDGQQSLGSFLAKGLRGYVELFTPLGSLAAAAPAAVVVVLAVSLLWVVAGALRRGATAHAALLLSIPLVLAILFAAGVVGFYPFGGYLRHQHLVLLLFLLALGIGLNDAYERIQSGTLRAFALGVVVAIAVGSSVVAARRDPLGEFPESQPLAGELKAAFEYGEESTPVYTAVYPFYVIYADRFAEGIAYKATYGHYEGELVDVAGTGGFLLRLRLPREWDEYQVRTAPGRFVSLYRDRTLFHFPDEPGASVFSRLHELMAHRGLDRLRILRAVSEETLSSSVDVLGNAFARHGFDVLETQISDQGETWLIRRR
jgi:hypothetical protein